MNVINITTQGKVIRGVRTVFLCDSGCTGTRWRPPTLMSTHRTYKAPLMTTKKAEHPRIDAFELWCWRRLLRAPWTARRSNQSILKEISLGCSLEGLMLKLKLQYFGHLMWRVDSLKRPWCWEGLRAGGEGDDRGWDGWMALPTRWAWIWVDSGSWWWTGRPGVLQFMGSQRVGHNWATELNWTDGTRCHDLSFLNVEF